MLFSFHKNWEKVQGGILRSPFGWRSKNIIFVSEYCFTPISDCTSQNFMKNSKCSQKFVFRSLFVYQTLASQDVILVDNLISYVTKRNKRLIYSILLQFTTSFFIASIFTNLILKKNTQISCFKEETENCHPILNSSTIASYM